MRQKKQVYDRNEWLRWKESISLWIRLKGEKNIGKKEKSAKSMGQSKIKSGVSLLF